MSAGIRRRRGNLDIWPGFVDALTSLLLVMIFMMLLFAIGQFVLSDALAGKSKSLDSLNDRVRQLTLSVQKNDDIRRTLDARIAELSRLLGTTQEERDRFKGSLEEKEARATALSNDIVALETLKRQLESEMAQLLAKVNASGQELQARDARIADLDHQLKILLAERVNDLQKYRSEFFGKLKEALGNRDDIKIVGDRFVVPSDILYGSGSADLGPDAQASLSKLVNTIKDVSKNIPDSVGWVLRIDGHTDRIPIATERFPSNWELSTARAVAIVKFLIAQGIPANHLSANGFGQYQPVDASDNPTAYARNRRIEFQLTNR
jgi:chemotaxis protein MotB